MFKMENDPRITRIGKFMRKVSLDESPRYNSYHKQRLSFRPGLTGMWQVSGRNDITDFEEIVKFDVKYIDNWSLMLDMKILLKTVVAVLGSNGARQDLI